MSESLRRENERLRARVGMLEGEVDHPAACCGSCGAEIVERQARIDAALAVVMGTRAVGNPHLESVLTQIVEALKGEK